MKIWIFLILALLLLFWTTREGFNPATQRPEKTDPSLRRVVQSMGGLNHTDEYIESIQTFYDTKYLPEKKTPETQVVNEFVAAQQLKPEMSKDALKRMIEHVFLSTAPPPPAASRTTGGTTGGTASGSTNVDIVDAVCMDGSLPPMTDLKCTDTNTPPVCPPGLQLFLIFARGGVPSLKCVRNSLVYDAVMTQGQTTQNPCRNPSDLVGNRVPHSGVMEPGPPKCITNSSTSTTGGTASGTATASSSGTTTGGSSASSFGPNSGGGGNRRQQVFGPTFTGRGEGDGVVPMDSSRTNQYPELLGGGENKPSTRIEGGGIVPPSKSWQLAMSGTLPTDASLGTTENSKFLPFSRQPGDMELIPDPYRVSQQFSSASYSFKTEPVPFLTDFSAFQR
jgi:hypothetical protein